MYVCMCKYLPEEKDELHQIIVGDLVIVIR